MKHRNNGDQARVYLAQYDAWLKKANQPKNEETLIEWDRTQNGKKLLDWDPVRNVVRGLWQQAHYILSMYTRVPLDGTGTTMPTIWKLGNKDHNYQALSGGSPELLNRIREHWQSEVKANCSRMKSLGIPFRTIMRDTVAALRQANRKRKPPKGERQPPQSAAAN